MLIDMSNLFSGVPPVSILSVVGISIVVATLVLYMLSRVKELLIITFIAGCYAAVPLMELYHNTHPHG